LPVWRPHFLPALPSSADAPYPGKAEAAVLLPPDRNTS